MLSSISRFQKTIWNQWNIRIVIIFSLFLQIFLIVSAPSRKRTRGSLIFLVWLAYLLADWAASYCIGLISNNQEQKPTLSQNDHLMAFWGPFLLLHLGGPDSISAFALEDNELWLRHLVALIFQTLTAAYVFLLTLPTNRLWLPTILMFVAGLIKYVERTHALYVASMNNFRKSLLPHPDAGPNYAKLMEEHYARRNAGLPAKIIVIPELRGQSNEQHHSIPTQRVVSNKEHLELSNKEHLELVQTAFSFFSRFQGLIVDMIYSFKDRLDSQRYLEGKNAEEALRLLEIELNFMYEVFYTKAHVIRYYKVWFWGKLVSLISIISTIVLFIKEVRHGGNGFDKLDVKVTYALLFGAVLLDFMAIFMRFFTDYTATLSDESYSASCYQRFKFCLFKRLNEKLLACFLRLREPTWSKIKKGPYVGQQKLSTGFLFRRWCGSISGYNLLKYCLDESIPRVPQIRDESNCILQGIQRVCFKIVVRVQDFIYQRDKCCNVKNLLDQWRYQSTNPFLKMLWENVFDKLKKKSHEALDIDAIQSICSARGDQAIRAKLKTLLESLKTVADPLGSLKSNVDPHKVAAQLQSLKSYMDPSALLQSLNLNVDPRALLQSLNLNVDPNKVSALLKSLTPNMDPKDVAAKLLSLKSYMDPNEDEWVLKFLRPYVDSEKDSEINVDHNEAEWQLKILKICVNYIRVAAILGSLKPYVDAKKNSSILESTEQCVDPNEIATEPCVDPNEIVTEPCVDPNEIAKRIEILKIHADFINVAPQLESLKPYVDPNEVVFDESLILWHIATSLCHAEDADEVEGHIERKISMILSDYMLYLLIMQPNMMSAVAGIGQHRFQDTCQEAKNFFKKKRMSFASEKGNRKNMLKDACMILMKVPTEEKPIDVKGDRSKSLLFDACRLAKELNKVGDKNEKWDIIICVWVEMLSYAACHCRPTGHVQLMSTGGELISFVWLLMCHLGLSTQFQIKDGDARAKLIVGKLLNQSTKQAGNIEP